MADNSSFVPVRKRPRRLEENEEEQHNKPIAPNIHKFLSAGGSLLYKPRPEWLRIPNKNSNNNSSTIKSTFGRDQDTALILAIRENATEAALSLIAASSSADVVAVIMEPTGALLTEKANTKGITPLMLAAQKGNATILRAILRHVDPSVTVTSSSNGTSALLQAAHFGHSECCLILLQCAGRALTELANSNGTTPLMRAAQEGHYPTVKLLLQYISHHHVNRQNASHMSMVCCSRGVGE